MGSQRKQSSHLVCIYSPQSFTSLLAVLYLLPTFLPCMFSLWLTLFPRAALPHCLPLCEKTKQNKQVEEKSLRHLSSLALPLPFPAQVFLQGVLSSFSEGKTWVSDCGRVNPPVLCGFPVLQPPCWCLCVLLEGRCVLCFCLW